MLYAVYTRLSTIQPYSGSQEGHTGWQKYDEIRFSSQLLHFHELCDMLQTTAHIRHNSVTYRPLLGVSLAA